MGANVPNVSQDVTQQEPIMAKSDEKGSKTTDFEISRTLKEEMKEPGAIIEGVLLYSLLKVSHKIKDQIESIHNAVK